ncbi:hypothetical protein BST95_13670 [Halioglobus japonicus]|uniref:Cytochrome c domain-containing protein n=1 Tax=Halioglobus japonicus TaxID=930805 RepID=A0AAP8SPT2_9GAMM|nr:hypothetical protein [Halioglobus japonicus]AQA19134.1 hypothetical protein BST95_13670 [Halioglobus japonicus]PLW87839.1 hypothetical protein C0029_04510 [Halioglobus japonicus]GHD06289.1 hypothetical protein GCM10007052_00890 [Halioglobus japonicus]
MARFASRWLTAALVVLLAGCFQVEIAGPVSGSTITITELRSRAQVLDPVVSEDQTSIISRVGQGRWNGFDDLQRLINLGNFFIDAGSLVDTRFYLVTVSGGVDVDANTDGQVDANGTPVAGEWHAIMRGSDLKEGGGKVSVLTEALYQVVREEIPQLNNPQLLARLDELARTIITDTTDDGTVDYADVLNWTVLFDVDKYQLDYASVEQLQGVITAGSGNVSRAAFQVIGEDELDALAFFEEKIADQIIQARCVNCHVDGGVARNTALVFARNNNPNYVEQNHQVFVRLAAVREVTAFVTSKAQGQSGHRGGVQLRAGSEDLENLFTYLRLL